LTKRDCCDTIGDAAGEQWLDSIDSVQTTINPYVQRNKISISNSYLPVAYLPNRLNPRTRDLFVTADVLMHIIISTNQRKALLALRFRL